MKKEIAVGILFFVALGILGYYTIIMSGDIFKKYDYYRITVVFPSVDGLEVKAKVKINGVVSGTVDEIKLLPDNNVFVALKMFNKFVLRESYKISLRNESALGGKFIGIDPGLSYRNGKYFAVLNSRDNLKGLSSGDVLSELSDMIAENRENLYSTVKNIKDITAKINDGQGTIGQLINEKKIYNNTDDLIKEVREAMEDSREQAPVTSFIRAALMAF